MNKNMVNLTAQKMQVKFNQFFSIFSECLTVPQYKAVSDISRGILSGGSLLLNQIAANLHQNITVKKIAERFHRHLSCKGLHDVLRQRHMQRQCHHFNQDTLIIVDGSDLVKREATQMEGLAKVRDGSKGTHDKLGYELMNFVAWLKEENGYRLLPVSSDIHSQSVSEESLFTIVQDRIDEITLYSNNKGVFVFDRGFDKRGLIEHLVQNGNSFIIRGMGQRFFIQGNTEVNLKSMASTIELTHRIAGKTKDRYFECGAKRVCIRTSPNPRHNAPFVEVWLVCARYRNNRKKGNGYFHFLCDFPHQNLSEEELINKVITSYRLRWKIEEVHRHLKQDYGWEEMQLMSFDRLQNLNMIFWLAISFLYSCKAQILQVASTFPIEFSHYRKRTAKLFEFCYYALKKAVARIFQNWDKYTKISHPEEPLQLYVRFF